MSIYSKENPASHRNHKERFQTSRDVNEIQDYVEIGDQALRKYEHLNQSVQYMENDRLKTVSNPHY